MLLKLVYPSGLFHCVLINRLPFCVLHAGITQEHIDELRDVAPNRMLNDLVKLKQSNEDLEKRDEIGASFVSARKK